jgi:hypothetical protein
MWERVIMILEHPVSSRRLSLSGLDFRVVIYKGFLSGPAGGDIYFSTSVRRYWMKQVNVATPVVCICERPECFLVCDYRC